MSSQSKCSDQENHIGAGRSRSAPIVLWRTAIRITDVQLEWAIIGCGIIVAAWQFARMAFRRRPWALADRVNLSAMQLNPHVAVGLALLFLIAPQIVMSVLLACPVEIIADKSLQSLATAMMASESGKLLFIAVASTLMFRQRWTASVFLAPTKSRWLKAFPIGLAIYVASYPLVNCLLGDLGLILIQDVLRWPCPAEHSAISLLTNPAVPLIIKVLAITSAVIISPISEELFFRGVVQNALASATHRAGLAVALAGVAFGMMHVPLYQHIPALSALGIILGWSYYRFNTLAVPITTHIIFNATTLILLMLSMN